MASPDPRCIMTTNRNEAQRRSERPSPVSPVSPLTDRFGTKWRALRNAGDRQRKRKDVWYSAQEAHRDGWLEGYKGPGAYGRGDCSRSAEFVQDHVVNPQMLVHVAEAVGIEPDVFERAIEGALTNRATRSDVLGRQASRSVECPQGRGAREGVRS